MLNRFSSVRYCVFGALLFVLLAKLCYTGAFFYTLRPVSLSGILESRSALAGDESQKAVEEAPGHPQIVEEKRTERPRQRQAKNDFKALEVKRRQLEQRETAIEEERKRLDLLKEEINAKLLKIAEIQKAVQGDLERKEALKNDRIKHLIKVYRTMPPRKAAVLIEKLDMDVIIALFSEMKGENVGQILPYVSAEKAAKISERLAKLGL